VAIVYAGALAEVLEAAARLRAASAEFSRAREDALSAGDANRLARLNRSLMAVERAFVETAGIPGDPGRHLIYAPKFTYAPELLPGIAEAVEAGDAPRAVFEARRVAAALKRAAAILDDGASPESEKPKKTIKTSAEPEAIVIRNP
jgi:hypothetical protein